MKFTEHNFISKEDKRVCCTICLQSWSSYPRTDCPGVPVVDYAHKAETLLTLHQLEKAHLHPVDAEQPDAAYRIPYPGDAPPGWSPNGLVSSSRL
jgi:hypothetical protein